VEHIDSLNLWSNRVSKFKIAFVLLVYPVLRGN
jgi:hypothetical protein